MPPSPRTQEDLAKGDIIFVLYAMEKEPSSAGSETGGDYRFTGIPLEQVLGSDSVAANLSRAGEDVSAYNVEFITELAQYGVVDQLLQSGYAGLEPLFPDSSSDYGEEGEYQARRDRLRELARLPGFGDFVRTPFAQQVLPLLVERVITGSYEADELQTSLEGSIQLATDPAAGPLIQTIIERNPHILDLIACWPDDDNLSIDEKRGFLAELASLEAGTVHPDATNPYQLGELSPGNQWRVLQAIDACDLRRYAHGDTLFDSHFLNWIIDPSTGTYETKRRLCADPEFAKGLIHALSTQVLVRLEALMTGSGERNSEHVRVLITEGFTEDEADDLLDMQVRNLVEARAMAIEMFSTFHGRYGLDCFELLEAWEESGPLEGNEDQLDFIRKNIETMQEIIAMQPGQPKPGETGDRGVCRELYKRFFIRCFGRYDAKDLYEQYLTQGSTGPHALALVGTTDRNWSLHQFITQELQQIREALAAKGVRLRIAEAINKREVGLVLGRSARQYGPARLGLAIAHGAGEEEGEGIGFSPGPDGSVLVGDFLHIVNRATHEDSTTAQPGLGKVLELHAPLGYHCCGAGIQNSSYVTIGEASAIALGASVMASDGPYSLRGVRIYAYPREKDLKMAGRYVDENGVKKATTTYDGMHLREQGRTYSPWPADRDETITHIMRAIDTMDP
jgi:hypothetical protein